MGWAIKTIYKKQSRGMLKRIPEGPEVSYLWTLGLKRALNSSGVLDETTEGGRLFHTGIVLGKSEFFRASQVYGAFRYLYWTAVKPPHLAGNSKTTYSHHKEKKKTLIFVHDHMVFFLNQVVLPPNHFLP